MNFKKIGITDIYSLNATYTNNDGDTITLSGVMLFTLMY